jgi:adenylate cyclase
MAFSQGREAAIMAGEKQMRQMSLRLVDGYRYALEGGYEAIAVASTLPQLVSRPPLELEDKQAFFLEVLRNVPNATSILAGYPDGSYIQAINAANPQVRFALSAPDDTAFAFRIVAPHEKAGQLAAMRFLDAKGQPDRPAPIRGCDIRSAEAALVSSRAPLRRARIRRALHQRYAEGANPDDRSAHGG